MHLVDRSRYLTQLQKCSFERYLRYHSGTGYGVQRKGTHLPLTTGVIIHAALAEILSVVQRDGVLHEEEAVRCASKWGEYYLRLVRARGFLNVNEEQEQVVREQKALTEGLVLAWVKVMLPILRHEFEIVHIEKEELREIGPGVTRMTRPDIVLRRKSDKRLGVHDFKTTSLFTDSYIQEYKESVQMVGTAEDLEARLGEPVDHYFVHVLIKGWRKKDYDTTTRDYTGPKRQNNFLCYAYKQDTPPALPTWMPKFKYRGQDGKMHTLGRGWEKTPVWQHFTAQQWVSQLPREILNELFALVGPYYIRQNVKRAYTTEMYNVEADNVGKLWRIHEATAGLDPFEPKTLETAAQEFPRSWQCHKYGYRCDFAEYCIDGKWDSSKYIPRRPHHEAEVAQMLARGLDVPPEEFLETEESYEPTLS